MIKEPKISRNILDTPSYWNEYPERDVEFVRWYPCKIGPLNEKGVFPKDGIEKPRDKLFAFYCHVPFCNNVCISCPYNKFNTCGDLVVRYVDALKKEISNYALRPYFQDSEIISGYFGGGTPTALSTEQLEEVLTELFRCFNIRKNATITLETTPVDIDEYKAEMLLKRGINRISMGVQAFDDTLLRGIGRTHTAEKAKETLSMLRKIGFKHFSMDLMYGLPGQTMQQWEDTIDQLLNLKIDSMSLYLYLVIPSSPLFLKIQRGTIPPCPDKKVQDEMYWAAVEKILSAKYYAVTCQDFGGDPAGETGYEGLESYDLGKNGYLGLIVTSMELTAHLSHTWYECGDLLALGSGGYGYVNNHMYLNEPNINKYIDKLSQGELPIVMGAYVSHEERMARSMVLGLKLLRVLREDFKKRHGLDMVDIFADKIRKLEGWGLVKLTDESLQVTFPKGWYYMDNISKTFYTDENYRLPQPSPASTNILKWLKNS